MGKNPPDRCAALTISAGVPSRGKTQAGNRGENARLVWTWQWWADLSSSCLAATGHPTEGKSSPLRREAVGLGWQQQWGTFCVPPLEGSEFSLCSKSLLRDHRGARTQGLAHRGTRGSKEIHSRSKFQRLHRASVSGMQEDKGGSWALRTKGQVEGKLQGTHLFFSFTYGKFQGLPMLRSVPVLCVDELQLLVP